MIIRLNRNMVARKVRIEALRQELLNRENQWIKCGPPFYANGDVTICIGKKKFKIDAFLISDVINDERINYVRCIYCSRVWNINDSRVCDVCGDKNYANLYYVSYDKYRDLKLIPKLIVSSFEM